MSEKFIVRVIRHQAFQLTPESKIEERVDQIYEQEFGKLDIGDLAVMLNRKDGQEKDKESIKLNEPKMPDPREANQPPDVDMRNEVRKGGNI